MIKKTISYTDYDGVDRTEDFWFNLSKAELTRMQLSEDGGLEKRIRKIVDEKDTPRIIEFFETFILSSYGEKSADGKHFLKVRDGHKLSDDFAQSEAYSVLFMELVTDADKAADFIKRVVPPDVSAQMNK